MNDDDVQAILAWEQALDTLDYHALLGVDERDEELLVEQAYHRFALRFHPDCHPDVTPRIREALTKIFQRGVEARRVLCDSRLRVRYRESRASGNHRLDLDAPTSKFDLDRDLPNLHVHCRSAGAKLEVMAAARAWTRHAHDEVRRRLLAAMAFDGGANPEIRACMEVLPTSGSQSTR